MSKSQNIRLIIITACACLVGWVLCYYLVVLPPESSIPPESDLYPSGPFTYDYTKILFGLPFEALSGNNAQFLEWKDMAYKEYMKKFKEIPISTLTDYSLEDISKQLQDDNRAYALKRIIMPLEGVDPQYGGLLAIPHIIRPDRALIVAIHGHEEASWGAPALDNFNNKGWMHHLAEAGHLVYAPISMYHEQIKNLADEYSYPLTWARLVSDSIDFLQTTVFKEYPHNGMAACGLSAGGLTSWLLMAARPDINAAVIGGSIQPLNFLRNEYRIKDHPDCWDIPWLDSYTAIQSLIAPRPVMIIEGRQDSMFPRLTPLERNSWFSGSQRGISTEEFVGGHLLLLKHVWELSGRANNLTVFIHNDGHEFKPLPALKFIDGERNNHLFWDQANE